MRSSFPLPFGKDDMANENKHRVCPVSKAGALDSGLRRLLQNPKKILGPYVKEGMTVLDVGCGPGYFTIDMARLVGDTGKVIAVDLQQGMLQLLRAKAQMAALEKRIEIHRCDEEKIGVAEPVDFAFLFYLVHEAPNAEGLFKEMLTTLKPNGRMLIVEPLFRVSKKEFEKTVKLAQDAGFALEGRPKIFLSKAAVFRKNL